MMRRLSPFSYVAEDLKDISDYARVQSKVCEAHASACIIDRDKEFWKGKAAAYTEVADMLEGTVLQGQLDERLVPAAVLIA